MKTQTESVLISGVSKGLGRSMAIEFANAGYNLIGCARNTQALSELRQELGSSHCLEAVDISSAEAVEHWSKDVLDKLPPPALLINNAGQINVNAPLWKISASELEAVFAVNVFGTANIIRSFLPAMIEAGRGLVVNFSSYWGRSSSADVAPYCSSKWAIEGLTQALAAELPPGLAAVALNPGIIDTDMLRSCFGESAAEYPSADSWAKKAVPFICTLGRKQNGKQITVPGF